MTAPEILRGPMDRGTPWRLRMERYQWVIAIPHHRPACAAEPEGAA